MIKALKGLVKINTFITHYLFRYYPYLLPMDATSLFFDACRFGKNDVILNLLTEEPNLVNARDAKGFTPLIIAVYNHQPDTARLLIEKGADVNAQDAAGNTALMGMAFKGYTELAELLIQSGAEVNLRNGNGAPALTFAATFGRIDVAELLLKNGALVNIPDARGKTALDHAVIQENEQMIALLEPYA